MTKNHCKIIKYMYHHNIMTYYHNIVIQHHNIIKYHHDIMNYHNNIMKYHHNIMNYHHKMMKDHYNIMNHPHNIMNYNPNRRLPYKTITAFHSTLLLLVGIADHLTLSCVHISIIYLHLFCIQYWINLQVSYHFPCFVTTICCTMKVLLKQFRISNGLLQIYNHNTYICTYWVVWFWTSYNIDVQYTVFKQLHNIFVEFVLCLIIPQPFFHQHLKHFEFTLNQYQEDAC